MDAIIGAEVSSLAGNDVYDAVYTVCQVMIVDEAYYRRRLSFLPVKALVVGYHRAMFVQKNKQLWLLGPHLTSKTIQGQSFFLRV